MIKKYYVTDKYIPKIVDNISCIGNFDASHKGHQALYKKTINLARKHNKKAYIIIFDKDPNVFLFKKSPLYSLKTRFKLYEYFGFDGIIIIKTNKKFFNLSADRFISLYLLKLNIYKLIVGYDFRFGKNHDGNIKLLKKHFKDLIVVKPIKYNNIRISTKYIKKLIINNKFNEASKMLGYELKII